MSRERPDRRNHGCHAVRRRAASPQARRVCPGRWAGRLPGRWPGSPDLPAHLPALVTAYPLAGGEMYLPDLTGTDD
jgi:hypothetical protein